MSSARKSWHVLFADEPSAVETPPPYPPPASALEGEPQETGPLGPSSPIVKSSQSRSPSTPAMAKNLLMSQSPSISGEATNLARAPLIDAKNQCPTQEMLEGGKPSQPPRAGHPDSPSPFSTNELHGLREEEARVAEVTGSRPAPVVSGPPGNAVTGEKNEPKAEASVIWGQSLHAIKKEGLDEAHARRGLEELRGMYPHLALTVQQISAAKHGFLKRAFELIDDAKAAELDAKVKRQRVLEVKTELKRDRARREVLTTLIRYVD